MMDDKHVNNKKSILFVINTMGQAGAEKALLALMNMFDSSRYELYLYVLMAQGEMIHEVPAHVTVLNKRYCDISVLAKAGRSDMIKTVLGALLLRGGLFRNFGYIVSNAFAMIRDRRFQTDKLMWRVLADTADRFDKEFDLAVAYLEGGSTYYTADYVNAKHKAGFVHIDYAESGYTRKLDGGCYARLDRIFTVSDEVRENFLKVYPEYVDKTRVFHNFLNTEDIKKRAKAEGGFTDDYDGIRLLTVGRITYQKGYDIAVEAMKILKDRGIKARWYVLGDGPLRDDISRQIRKSGLEKDFVLLGACNNPYPYYAQTDIYVHATRFEGKSIAIQEAQVLGCVIAASDCSGNREQIENGVDGILFEYTPGKIADAIQELTENPEKAEMMALAASQKKINNIKDMEHIYELL